MVMHVCTLLVPKLCTTYPSTCHQTCFWRAWYVFREGLHLICHFSILMSQKTLNGGHLWWVCLLVSACAHKPPSPHFFSFSFCCSKGFSKTKQIKKKRKKVMRLEHQTALLLLLRCESNYGGTAPANVFREVLGDCLTDQRISHHPFASLSNDSKLFVLKLKLNECKFSINYHVIPT